jgi:hypothetical protein
MFGRYGPETLPVAERLLETGTDSMQALLEEAGATALDPPEGWPAEPSFNTPEELRSQKPEVRNPKSEI